MYKATMSAGLGGFLGTVLRFLSEKLGAVLCHGAFPLGTFIVNVVGCFIIGIFFGLWGRHEMSAMMNALLITGFCGGFTTFSSFSHDMYGMLERRQWGKFALYLTLSVGLGLLCVWLGMKCV